MCTTQGAFVSAIGFRMAAIGIVSFHWYPSLTDLWPLTAVLLIQSRTWNTSFNFYFSLGGPWAYPLTYILTRVLQIQAAKGPVRSFTPQLLIHPHPAPHSFNCHWLGFSASYPSEQWLLFRLCPFAVPCQPLTTFFSHQGWLHLSLPKILQLPFLVQRMLSKF